MDSKLSSDLIKIPPGPERNKHYKYPYTGPYSGELTVYEINHLAEFRRIWGADSLAISHECPSCDSIETEWIRHEWNICFNCQIPFTLTEALDYQYFLDERNQSDE